MLLTFRRRCRHTGQLQFCRVIIHFHILERYKNPAILGFVRFETGYFFNDQVANAKIWCLFFWGFLRNHHFLQIMNIIIWRHDFKKKLFSKYIFKKQWKVVHTFYNVVWAKKWTELCLYEEYPHFSLLRVLPMPWSSSLCSNQFTKVFGGETFLSQNETI